MTSKLFFSSCFEDPAGERLHVRDMVSGLNPDFDRNDPGQVSRLPVWLAENFKALDKTSPATGLEKALFCVDGVRDSDVYVAVVRSRFGTGVRLGAGRAHASYFELEIYEAALLRKPTHIFILDEGELEPNIEALLKMLAPALPGLRWQPMTEAQIYDEIRRLLDQQMQPTIAEWLRHTARAGAGLINRLSKSRYEPYEPSRELPRFKFLEAFGDSIRNPDPVLVRSIIEEADKQENHNSKLAVLWIAIRELMGSPLTRTSDPHLLKLWDRSLSNWNSAGAWFGLHGHPHMGCLASLGTLAEVRARSGTKMTVPHGALASEYYSIAKKVTDARVRRNNLNLSREHAECLFDGGETSGAFAMRGSIRWAQGDLVGAINDYKTMLDLRQGCEEGSDQQIGEAKCELGFAMVMNGHSGAGVRMMESGLGMFDPNKPDGFQVRAMRKLGRAYLRAGSPISALRTLEKAYELAQRRGLYDQIGRLDQMAHQISKVLRRGWARR